MLSSYFSIREQSHLILLLKIMHRGHEEPREIEGAIEEDGSVSSSEEETNSKPELWEYLGFLLAE